MAIPQKSKRRVRCITLNLCGMHYGWFERRQAMIVRELKRLSPDIVCFQETTIRHDRPSFNQSRAAVEAAGLHSIAFASYGNPIEVMSSDQGGIAIASRWPLLDVRIRKLPASSGHPADGRVALLIVADAPGGMLTVVNTHLSWRPNESELRLVQSGLILDEFVRNGWLEQGARALFAGDMNANDREPAIELPSQQLRDAWVACHDIKKEPGYTWTTRNPLVRFPDVDRRLDYIFCPKGVRVLRSELIFDRPPENYVSDHFGLLADFDWG